MPGSQPSPRSPTWPRRRQPRYPSKTPPGGILAASRRGGTLAAGVVLLFSTFRLSGGVAHPATPGAAHRLVPAVAVERTLAAGGRDVFAAELSSGKTYRVQAEQEGVDLVLEVRRPDGPTVAVDSPLERWGTELLLVEAKAAGGVRIEVRCEQRGVGAGKYRLRLDELRRAAPAEQESFAALAAATEAGSAFHLGTGGSGARALAAWERARSHFHAAAEPLGEAESTTAVAALLRQEGQRRRAAELYREAALRWRLLHRPRREIRAWGDLGMTWLELGDLPAAAAALAHGLALARARGDAYGEADLGNDSCMVRHARGDLRAALGCYEGALAGFRRLGEERDEASVLNNLGYAHYSQGDARPAEESYRQALAIRRRIGDRAGEAQTLNNLAVLYRGTGEIGEALACYEEARQLQSSLHDRREEAAELHNLGVAYQSLGEPERAAIYLGQALAIRRAVEDRRGEIATLVSLGFLAQERGDAAPAATFYRQALDLARAISDRREEGLALSYLGEAHAAAGLGKMARAELALALAVQRQVGDRQGTAVTLLRQAAVQAAGGEPRAALAGLGEALACFRAEGDRVHEAAAAAARARLLRAAGRLGLARLDAAAAVAAVESVRTRLAGSELRAAFLGAQRDAFEVQVSVLMSLDAAHPGQGYARRALEASERGRARSLLDVLRNSGSGPPAAATCRDCHGGPAAPLASAAAVAVTSAGEGTAALASRRRDLERRLALLADKRQGLLGRVAKPAAGSLDLSIERLMAQLDVLDAEVGRRRPRYGDITRPEIPGVRDIQKLLDADTLLLEYALGRDRSYLWVVGRSSFVVAQLPAREAIESTARAYYRAISRPADPGDERRRLLRELGEGLAAAILGPVAGELGRHRLAIVADGALHFVPFDALPEPAGTGSGGSASAGGERQPLMVRHEVVELPSAAVLAASRRERGRRPAAPRLAMILADPVFDASDPRVAAHRQASGPQGQGRQVADRQPAAWKAADRWAEPAAGLGRLTFSRQEAQAIAAQAPPGEVATALDFAATRALAVSGRLRDFRYLHFATHGLFDAARPELSALVLSQVDAAGHPVEGSIRLRDVYGLDLAADLVVLSGCQTALGREVRGEGLLGLTRGFLYAGTARVVASLWWIDDRATAELMGKLYQGLWRQHLGPAAALRQARLAVAGEWRYRDPFYWGAPVLEGDWR